MNQIDKFYNYLQDLEENYTRLADLLQKKLSAVGKYDLTKMEGIMKDEQAYILLSKGFESNLAAHREKLGLKGATLGEVIEELPPEEWDRFRQLHGHLRRTLDHVKSLNEKCQAIIEDKLYTLDKTIKSIDKSENAIYHKDVRPPAGGQSSATIINKSI